MPWLLAHLDRGDVANVRAGRRVEDEQLAGQLRDSDLTPVSVHDVDRLFRVWLGPYYSAAEVESVIRKAIELGFERPHRVQR